MLSNVQSHYRRVAQGTIKNLEFFCKFISPAILEPVSAALLLLKTEVIAPVWVMIRLEVFLIFGVLQLIEQFNQCLFKYTALFNQISYLGNKVVMSNKINLHRCWYLLTSFQIFLVK